MFKLEILGSKTCLVGDTYKHRHLIKQHGGKWEKTMKMWWWKTSDKSRATACMNELNRLESKPEAKPIEPVQQNFGAKPVPVEIEIIGLEGLED